MATSAAAAIAAAQSRARREILQGFEDAGAVEPARAIAYDPPSRLHERQLAMLVNRGLLKPAGDGFWLDPAALELDRERQARVTKVGFAFLAVVGLAILVAGLVAGLVAK